MKKLIFCLLVLLTALHVDAQTNIYGRVYNELGNYNKHRGLTTDSNMNLPRVIPQYGFRKGAVMADTTKGVLRVFDGSQWVWQVGVTSVIIVNGGGSDPDTLKQVFLGDTTVVGTFTGSGGSSAWADITGKPTTLAGYGITDPIVLTSSSYSDPAWITSLAWSKITGAPSFLLPADTSSLSDRIDNAYTQTLPLSDSTGLELVKPNGLRDTILFISDEPDLTIYTKQQDTIALASFGAGSAAAGDTTAFSTSAIYGSFYNSGSDTLYITSFQIGLQGTSPSITTEVFYNDSLNVSAGATKLVNAGSAVTGVYGLTNVSSLDNRKIPPGVWVWVKTSVVTTKPTYFSLTLIGYKSRR